MIIKVKCVTLFTPGIYYWKIKNETKIFSKLLKACYLRLFFKAKLYKISTNSKDILINMLLLDRQYIWAIILITILGKQENSLIHIFNRVTENLSYCSSSLDEESIVNDCLSHCFSKTETYDDFRSFIETIYFISIDLH